MIVIRFLIPTHTLNVCKMITLTYQQVFKTSTYYYYFQSLSFRLSDQYNLIRFFSHFLLMYWYILVSSSQFLKFLPYLCTLIFSKLHLLLSLSIFKFYCKGNLISHFSFLCLISANFSYLLSIFSTWNERMV